jgi:hypothetical protein
MLVLGVTNNVTRLYNTHLLAILLGKLGLLSAPLHDPIHIPRLLIHGDDRKHSLRLHLGIGDHHRRDEVLVDVRRFHAVHRRGRGACDGGSALDDVDFEFGASSGLLVFLLLRLMLPPLADWISSAMDWPGETLMRR